MSAPLPPDLSRVDPPAAWEPWVPGDGQRFDARWAGHLVRRAAFGASPDEVRKAARDGLDATLDRLFHGDPRAAARRALLDDAGEQLARADEAEDEPGALRGWWVYAMLHGGHPLREKMVLFWHNHFATSIAKVRSPLLMFRQNQLLRQHTLGKFRPLLSAVSRDPAMLVWLDSNQNVKAHPNENFAREVMELFTLGVGHYSERDVREAARAFTGWHVNGDGDGFEFNAPEHDDGPKTVLGRTGPWGGDEVLRILLDQPACARFLAGKLYRFFVSETDPPKGLIEPLASQLRQSDYDIGGLVQTILRSRLFFSDHAYRQRIKSPVEYVLGLAKAAWPGPLPPTEWVGPLQAMGQALFAPPNVKGWAGGKSWLTDATLLARHNFAEQVIAAPPPAGTPSAPGITPPISFPSAAGSTDGPTETKPPSVPTIEVVPVPPKPFEAKDWMNVARPAGPAPAPLWYVRKMKARTPAAIVRAVGEQFFPGGLPEPVQRKLEAYLGSPTGPVPDGRIGEVIHAVLCLPEYQLC